MVETRDFQKHLSASVAEETFSDVICLWCGQGLNNAGCKMVETWDIQERGKASFSFLMIGCRGCER